MAEASRRTPRSIEPPSVLPDISHEGARKARRRRLETPYFHISRNTV